MPKDRCMAEELASVLLEKGISVILITLNCFLCKRLNDVLIVFPWQLPKKTPKPPFYKHKSDEETKLFTK